MAVRLSHWQSLVMLLLLFHAMYLYFILLSPQQHIGDCASDWHSNALPHSRSQLEPNVSTWMRAHTRVSAKVRRVNAIVTNYDTKMAAILSSLIKRKANSRDPALIALIRELIDPPSRHIIKIVRQLQETPQSHEVDRLLNKKSKGFFVECGALDGERSSNTLFLEQRRGWEGILIEMDPYFYTQLLGKSRRAYSINACLSPFSYPTEMEFKESTGGAGQLIDPEKNTAFENPDSMVSRIYTRKVPCFPLESILLALNKTSVDYFSLDVEGFELDILRTVPFEAIDVGVLSVEYVHGRAGKEAYRQYMLQKGYHVYKDVHHHDFRIALFVDDFIFAKQHLIENMKH